MNIDIVVPVTTPDLVAADDFQSAARVDTDIRLALLDEGPPSVESHVDEALALPDTLRQTLRAEANGSDAVIIDCAGDPGLSAAREVASILVLGPMQTSMHVAAMLAHNFSVITTTEGTVLMTENLARVYGLTDRLCSVRTIEIGVLELDGNVNLATALLEQSIKAIEQDGAHAIVLGCTGMNGCSDELRAGLAKAGHVGIPVIDPALTALKMAEALVDLGLRPSQRTYPKPATTMLIADAEARSRS